MTRARSNTVINRVWCRDAFDFLPTLPASSVDLVFTSPPYEAQRIHAYGGDKPLKGEQWVAWVRRAFIESMRVCRGLVAFVLQSPTKDFRWGAGPCLLVSDLVHKGIPVRRPIIYYRSGIFGGAGPDWLRCNYEFIICANKPDARRAGNPFKLPWSDPAACGGPPKYPPGGPPSHRKKDGTRVKGDYTPPERCNPGDVIRCKVGGGHMGDPLAHENDAPFPEKLAEFFVRTFCPPDGIVLDPFGGSGTTAAVAVKTGRRFIYVDIDEAQCRVTLQRLKNIKEKSRD